MAGIRRLPGSTQRRWRRHLAALTAVVSVSTLALVGWAPAVATSAAAAPPATSLLTAVGVFAQSGHDQVVFQFSNAVPGYTITSVSAPIHADPSDKVVPVQGNAFMKVTMKPASGVDLTQPDAPKTYTGPTAITLNGKAVVQVVEVGDFEGVLTWVVGLTEQVPFVAVTATNPARIAIDFQDPTAVTANPSFTV
jgi:hypothetical protein